MSTSLCSTPQALPSLVGEGPGVGSVLTATHRSEDDLVKAASYV